MKSKRKFIVAVVIFALTVMYGFVPAIGEAASFESAKDTISDSDLGATGVTHTFVVSSTQAIDAGGRIDFVFDPNFAAIASGTFTCAGTGAEDDAGPANTLRCVYAGGLAASLSTHVLTAAQNPNAIGSYIIHIYSYNAASTLLEHSSVRVAIVNDVLVTATVDASLTFFIGGLATTSEVNTVLTTGSSTSQTLAFGTLPTSGTRTLGQQLRVTTNAYYGYTVTVFQDHNLLANNGADIDSFVDGTPSLIAAAWAPPTGLLGSENTYGHFGVTSDDASLSANNFGAAEYKGLDGTTPLEVMYHTGPADGLTDSIGSTTVAYTIGINALQEAGDYSNTLTYICTPTY